VGVIFSDESKLPSCVLQKRDGTHGYLASDLACIKYRMHNWNPEKIVYFVDGRQQLHFKQAFDIAYRAGWVSENVLFHAFNGFIALKDGAMSTRDGRIIRLEALLDEAEKRAKDIILEKREDMGDVEIAGLAKMI
jgi:arginyl-tRNA synthetase